MARRWTVLAVGILALGLLSDQALARGGRRGGDPVSALERSAARVGSAKGISDRPLTAVQSPRLSVWLRPGARLVGVTRGLSQRGFFLNGKNRLSAGDRKELGRLIRTYAPGTTSSSVHGQLAAQARKARLYQQTLRQQDPLIQGLLDRASSCSSQKDVVLWEAGRASLVYRPSAKVLVGCAGLSSQGFFLNSSANGRMQVQTGYLEGLREFLHRHSPGN